MLDRTTSFSSTELIDHPRKTPPDTLSALSESFRVTRVGGHLHSASQLVREPTWAVGSLTSMLPSTEVSVGSPAEDSCRFSGEPAGEPAGGVTEKVCVVFVNKSPVPRGTYISVVWENVRSEGTEVQKARSEPRPGSLCRSDGQSAASVGHWLESSCMLARCLLYPGIHRAAQTGPLRQTSFATRLSDWNSSRRPEVNIFMKQQT